MASVNLSVAWLLGALYFGAEPPGKRIKNRPQKHASRPVPALTNLNVPRIRVDDLSDNTLHIATHVLHIPRKPLADILMQLTVIAFQRQDVVCLLPFRLFYYPR